MPEYLQIHNKGLYTSPNEFSSVPDGAMVTANNCSIDVDNILEPRRGNSRLFQFPISSDRAKRYSIYQSKLIAAWSGGKIGYENSTVFTAVSGTYNNPSDTLGRTKFLPANNNLYFTSDTGVYRMDAYNATPTLSGMTRGLDIQLSLSGSSGFLTTGNQTAYRIIWGIKDANKNIITGAPSGRAIAINTTGTDKDVVLVTTIPSSITTNHFFQIYRSKKSGGPTVVPDDEMGLVYENNPTAGEITAKTLTITDRTTDDLRGATLYTSPSQEGILQSNDPPPLARDIEEFFQSVVYANTTSKHRLTLTLIGTTGTAGIAVGDTITIAGQTYTFQGTEDAATKKIALYGTSTTSATATLGSPTLTAVTSTASCRVGQSITGAGIPLSTFIGSFTSNTIGLVDSAGVAVNATAGAPTVITVTIADGTPAQNIADTATSMIRIINRNTANTLIYAAYLSGENDLPGRILLEERGLGGALFSVIASAHGTAYDPVLPTSGTTVSSSNDNLQNQIMFSKNSKAEAVPLLNYKPVGSANNAILRIKRLRNTLFIFKDKEGIFKMTGRSPDTFDVELFDSSANLLAPESVAVLNNEIWCLTDQGITVVTETGSSVVSRPIEDLILEEFGAGLNAVKYYSHAIGYETDRKYILFTVSASADTVATQAFVFNVFTKAFTRWPLSKSAGIVNTVDDKLYLGDGASEWTEQERKARDYTDYIDYGTACTVSSSSGTSVVLTSVTGIEVGDLLYQSSGVQSAISAINVPTLTVTVNDTVSWAAAAATFYKGITCEAEWTAITGGNPGTAKQFPEISMLFKTARFNSATLSFATDVSGYFEDVTIYGNRTGLWGLFPWGTLPWGSTTTSIPIRTYVPLEKQRGSLLRVRFTLRQGYSIFKLNGFVVPIRSTESFKIAK